MTLLYVWSERVLILAGVMMAAARVLAFKRTTVFESSYTYSICATKRFNFSFHLGNAKIQKHRLKGERRDYESF